MQKNYNSFKKIKNLNYKTGEKMEEEREKEKKGKHRTAKAQRRGGGL